ncbi:MAG: NADH-quinone oxidoreductase subunit D [Planctomycetes bacterium]|nr:NADH-quinone oxidoreductase subunit D [Planctomycetota bacterium]
MDLVSCGVPPGFPDTASNDGCTEEFYLNMGPQHPSTHGVLRLVVKLDGETVKGVVPHLGYIHRSIEKMSESQTYLQGIHLTDRLDYLSCHMTNLGLCMAVEKGAGFGVPERGEYIRVIMCELQRLQSHLLWWATFGMDLGALTAFLYGFDQREQITDLFEEVCGARLTMNYFRPGGSSCDVPDTFIPRCEAVLEGMKVSLDEYEKLVGGNMIVQERCQGIGVLSKEQAISFGCSGPIARASGLDYDLRRDDPYSIYDRFDFDVPLGTTGDCYDRYTVRIEEMRQSMRIIEQAIKTMPSDGPYRSKLKPVVKIAEGHVYSNIETARGSFGTYIVSDKKTKPYRIKYRSPSFSNISILNDISCGFKIADLVTILATLDPVIPDIDR